MRRLSLICVFLAFALDALAQPPKLHITIRSVEVKRPNILVRGANLAKVEIWAAPTGTQVTPEMYLRLGTAKRLGAAGNNELWVFPIPPEPFSAAGIFAKGFDANGKAVVTKSLPYYGASDLYEALWGKSKKEPSSQN